MSDTDPTGPSTRQSPDARPARSVEQTPNALRHYAMVLRRRWRWIALGLVMGLLAGIAATLVGDDTPDTTAYYKATNTLIYNAGRGSAPGDGTGTRVGSNLAQTAFLVRSADIVNGVASALGVTISDVNEQVNGVARSDVGAIDITAISTDPEQAVLMADTTARVLLDYVATPEQQQYATARDQILRQLDQLNTQRSDLENRLAADPANTALQAQLDQVEADYATTYGQLQTLTGQGTATGGFTTLQTATPVQINAKAYNDRLQDNREARGGATVVTPFSSTATDRETDLSTGTTVSDSARIAIGLATGLVLGLLTAFLVEAWDDRLRRSDRVEAVTGLPVLAEVPVLPVKERAVGALIVIDSPRSAAAERYRTLRTSMQFAVRKHLTSDGVPAGSGAERRRAPVILITSPNPGDGKTTTVANVAATLGDAGLRVLVVDCDHRKPSVGRYLDPALSFDGVTEPAATRLHNVWFVPPPVSHETPDVLPELITIIKRWRTDFDIVLLDTPPMLMMNDAIGLLPEADSVLLVVRAGRTRVGEAERVVSLIDRFRADIMGVVLNSCSPRDSAQRYGYGYYHDARSRKKAAASGDSPTEDDVAPPPADGAPIQPPQPAGTTGGADGNGQAASGASVDPTAAAAPPSPPTE